MATHDYQYRQCTNKECELRFPCLKEELITNRCPVCRSPTILINTYLLNTESENLRSNMNRSFEVLLDNIRSAWNVGSILRTADGIGISKIYLCGITPHPDQKGVLKTSLGAEMSVPWESYKNSYKTILNLQSRGYQIWVLEETVQSENIFLVTEIPSTPLVLVLGSEKFGVDPEIISLSDRIISIPMHGIKRSLNVSVAFGIAAVYLQIIRDKWI